VADAFEMLVEDHRRVAELLGKATTGEPAADVIASIIKELSIHDAIERVHVYPQVRDRLENGHFLSQQSIAEHGEVARVLLELDRRRPDDTAVPDLVVKLADMVTAHVEEEEAAIFPGLRRVMAGEEIDELATTLRDARSSAPTRPHPHVPQDGTSAKLAGATAAPFDKLRDKIQRRP
jgi:hemerythrin superfamily protein